MRAHHKLTSQERDKIAYGYAVGESLREMARRLGRSPSSIFEEIKRNTVDGRYHSIRAHQASEARRQNSHKKYRLKTRSTLQSYVVEKLELGWSPEQIAGRLEKRSGKAYDQRRNTSTMSPFTSIFMTSRGTICDCGRSSQDAIANDDAGWVEKADL